jgi:hypothetical protein
MEPNDFRYLVKLAGKVIFITALIICALMMLAGFWPSLLVLLMILLGAGMITLPKIPLETSRLDGLKTALSQVRLSAVPIVLKRALAVFAVFIIAGVLIAWVSKDYFKARDTRSDCRGITKALDHYYQHEHKYPSSLSVVLDQYPLRQGWKKDHWGNDYAYIIPANAQAFTLISPGKDKQLNTGDDIVFGSKP